MQVLKNSVRKIVNHALRAQRHLLVLTVLVHLHAAQAPFQGETIIRENKVKAVFLYNFSQFVTWPAGSFDDEGAPFTIGILGKDTFSEYLSEIIDGEMANNRPIVIKKFTQMDPEAAHCHILFIEKTFSSLTEATDLIRGKPILTVSDHENFMRENGILRFFIESDKVRFEVNRDAALTAGLEISPKLLKLASIYKSRK